MTDADETRLLHAAKHASAQLGVIEAAYGATAVQVYAAGMAMGIRNYMLKNFGSRTAFDLFEELAEGSLTPILPKDETVITK